MKKLLFSILLINSQISAQFVVSLDARLREKPYDSLSFDYAAYKCAWLRFDRNIITAEGKLNLGKINEVFPIETPLKTGEQMTYWKFGCDTLQVCYITGSLKNTITWNFSFERERFILLSEVQE